MHQINTRGTFLVSKECLPYLLKSNHAHILNISPPLNLNPKWFAPHVAYTTAKYGMSMCVLGMAQEFRDQGISVNALWPRTAIHTSAIEMLTGPNSSQWSRKPEIMSDAAYAILIKEPSKSDTGRFFIDDEVLRANGVTDLKQYACDIKNEDKLMTDFFLDDDNAVVLENKNTENVKIESGNIPQLFDKIKSLLSADIVAKVQAVYEFNITGDEEGTWFLDLKNGSGSCGRGSAPIQPDACLTMKSKNFTDMFEGKLKAAPAFMTGKLKITGDLQKAMKLEKLMKSLKTKL